MPDDAIPASQRAHYTEQRLCRSEYYEGKLSDLTDAQALDLTKELMRYWGKLTPPPPYGLPGHNRDPEAETMKFIGLGARYFREVLGGHVRSQWNIHNEIGGLLREKYFEGHKAATAEIFERLHTQNEERLAATAARTVATTTYFISADDGPIKIGCTVDPSKRLRNLQTSHHARLSILATAVGGVEVERAYHVRFAAHRLEGEWFARHPDILAEIERLAA